MGAKFLFLFVAASKFSPSELSIYGGLSSLLIMAAYIIGGDLYIETTRKMINENSKVFFIYLSNQILFSSLLLFGMIFYVLFVPSSILTDREFLFATLLIFEFLSQEIYRFLIGQGSFKVANLQFFIKSGFWCVLSSVLLYFDLISSLNDVLIIWILSTVIAMVFGAFYVFGIIRDFRMSISLGLFVKSLKNNLFIFSSSLSLLVLNNLDKIYLSYFSPGERVASYIFYSSLVGSALTIIYAGIVNPYYKKIVQAQGLSKEINRLIYNIFIGGISVALFVGLSLHFFISFILELIGNDYFIEHIDLMYYLIVSMFFLVLSLAPHYYLFSKQLDGVISKISMATVLVQVSLMYVLSHLFGVDGVVYSVVCSSLLMLSLKTFFAHKASVKVE